MKLEHTVVAVGFILALFDICNAAGVTADQMISTARLMRDICQPKYKIPDEVADKLSVGVFPEDKQGKCYIHCMMEMMQAMKKSKILYESSLKQIDLLLPEELRPSYKAGFEACRNSIDGLKDPCDAATALLKCLTNKIDGFIFP